jgi:hypothetical protein
MPKTTVSVKLLDLPAVSQTTRALMRLLHEIEAADPSLLPYQVARQAEETRSVVDEWRLPGRHKRRHERD